MARSAEQVNGWVTLDSWLEGGYDPASSQSVPVAQLDRVSASEAEGQWFKSTRVHQFYRFGLWLSLSSFASLHSSG